MATKHVDMDMQILPQWQILTVYIHIDILVQFYTDWVISIKLHSAKKKVINYL